MKRKGFKKINNQHGVALMLVLSAVVMLTTMLIQFAYDTNVQYHLALNGRDRLKAYYLAKSAYSFMLLELKFDKMFQRMVKRRNLSKYIGSAANTPLCQQFPISTGLIRTVFTGGGLEKLMAGASDDVGADKAASNKIEKMRHETSVSQEKTAQEFLNFEGDFDAECIDESTKINLNGFYDLSKKASEGKLSPYDDYKHRLYAFLSKPKYSNLFNYS